MKTLILLLLPFLAAAQESPTDLKFQGWKGKVDSVDCKTGYDTVHCIMLISDTNKNLSPVVTMRGYVVYTNATTARYYDEKLRTIPLNYYIWDIKILNK